MMKIGPWGGHSGYLKDIKEAPLCLNSVTIRSGKVVYSLAFSYSDGHGKQHHAGPWGICESFSYGRFDTVSVDVTRDLFSRKDEMCVYRDLFVSMDYG